MNKTVSLQTCFAEREEKQQITGEFQALQLIGNNLRERACAYVLNAMKERGIRTIDFCEIDDSTIERPVLRGTEVLQRISITDNEKVLIGSYDEDDYESYLDELPYGVVVDILNTFEEITFAYDDETYSVDEEGNLIGDSNEE